MSTKADWSEQAAFMRDVGAVHAEWTTGGDLTKLVLGPPVMPRAATPAPAGSSQRGIAARLLDQHNTLFASSRMKPPFREPVTPEAAVPRAVRAKQAAAERGAKKVRK